MSGNDQQREFWSGAMATAWIERLDTLERGLAGINDALMAFADLKPGMAVLDIGCGPGTTTEQIAAVTGGRTVGLDISKPLIDAAKARSRGATEFIEADATDYPFRPEFDLVFSRLGLMFFADPVASFANIRRAVKPGGRLAFLVWAPMEEIPYLIEPLNAVRDLLPPIEMPPPDAPGGYALADSARTRRILEQSGWHAIESRHITPPSFLGATLAEAVEAACNLGPIAQHFREADEATKAEVRRRVSAILARFETSDGVVPPAACWLIEARA
jgi:SAM-dependent methyltransferase